MTLNANRHHHSSTPLWEKIIGSAGMVLIFSTLTLLLWLAITEKASQPHITFEITEINAVNGGYIAIVDVINRGTGTAADLVLDARFNNHLGASESATVKIDYLAPQSSQLVGFFFTRKPGAGELSLRPISYQEP